MASVQLRAGLSYLGWIETYQLESLVTASLVVFVIVFSFRSLTRKERSVKAPFVGYRGFWEPTLLLRLRFCLGAYPILIDGYKRFKNSMFTIRRTDMDILIVPNKYVDELRAHPKLNAIEAHVKAFGGRYSTVDLMLEGDIHVRILQTKLTPNLGSLIPVVQDELEQAMRDELPISDDATEVSLYFALLRIVARVSARVFVGLPLCRNEEWLQTSIEYTKNVFMTAILLRMIPSILHPVAVWFLPSSYALQHNLRSAKSLIGSLVEKRRSLEARNDTGYQKPDDLLQWMMDAAVGDEAKPDQLAHRQLLLTVAAIHTTTVTATQAIYDLCAHPEFFQPLREEIEEQLGGQSSFNKAALGNMRKMDSFMKESQRMNPIVLTTFDRLVKEPITLSDGLKLPRDTIFSIAAAQVAMDPAVFPDPEKFDPLRSYRKRLNTEEAHRYQFASTSRDDLHFGHGKHACPGRFFAANEIKMILSHLILHYDLEYLKGQGRPLNFTAHEAIYPDLNTKLRMKRRGPPV